MASVNHYLDANEISYVGRYGRAWPDSW